MASKKAVSTTMTQDGTTVGSKIHDNEAIGLDLVSATHCRSL